MSEHEEMLRAAPTTEDGGDFVLFEGRDQFVGQFHTAEEMNACIKEKQLKRPTLLMLSILKDWMPIYVPYERKKSGV
jgi:hypothetical protein